MDQTQNLMHARLTTTFIQIKYIFRIQIRKLLKETPLNIKQNFYLYVIYTSKEVKELGAW